MNGLLKIFVFSALVCYCTANERHVKIEQLLNQQLVRRQTASGDSGDGSGSGSGTDGYDSPAAEQTKEQLLKQQLVRRQSAAGDYSGGGSGSYYYSAAEMTKEKLLKHQLLQRQIGPGAGSGSGSGADSPVTDCFSEFANCNPGPYTTQFFGNVTQTLGSGPPGSYNVESTVNIFKHVSIPTLCGELKNLTQCFTSAISSTPAQCQQQEGGLISVFANLTKFVDYLCVQQLSNLEAAQKCLSYDLVANVACCGIKEYFSANCSAQDTLNCAQKTIAKGCGAPVGQAFIDILAQLSNGFLNGQLTSVLPFCPTQRNYKNYAMEWFKFF
jgi:hypothetical protein